MVSAPRKLPLLHTSREKSCSFYRGRAKKYFNSMYGDLIDEAKHGPKRRKVTYDEKQH
jgi:hypothetical protein